MQPATELRLRKLARISCAVLFIVVAIWLIAYTLARPLYGFAVSNKLSMLETVYLCVWLTITVFALWIGVPLLIENIASWFSANQQRIRNLETQINHPKPKTPPLGAVSDWLDNPRNDDVLTIEDSVSSKEHLS